MNTYKRYRLPPDIISYTVWLYYCFNLSHPDIEDLLAERGITVSHEPTRVRERGMRKFNSVRRAQAFVTAHAAVHALFNLGRHLVSANHYRNFRIGAFKEWPLAVA